ncbi:MAG TPA: NAD(P)/FAD-dependent oxidoreductase [Steroidobacteraceae bacterium]|nr:NAD(P)/FAD-dependent oxidoreductase [Steroidobacteraceae bacterium]
MDAKRLVIVGAGFAGLNAVRALARAKDLNVTVIDRENHHLFQPLLYQVAMAALSPADIAVPVRSLTADSRHVRVIKAAAQRVDAERRVVITDSGEYSYDFLMLACGAQHTYFGHDEWEANAPGLKTLPQATEIRRRVLEAFEAAERETAPDKQRQHLTFVIVGAGPTGVELAGAIGEMSRFTLAKDFRSIDPRQTRVILVEAGPRILPAFDANLAARAMRDLESLGVQTWTSARVTAIDAAGVTIGSEHIAASTVLWAAGVKASELGRASGFPVDEVGRVLVQDDLSLATHSNIFVCGDMARCAGVDGKPLPGVGAVAAQQGTHVAQVILKEMNGQPRVPFKYADKGKMATIGHARAVVEMGRLKLGGRIAWWFWLLVHIYYLNGFRNRLSVMLNWAWSYVTFNRGARLIVGKEWRSYGEGEAPSDATRRE